MTLVLCNVVVECREKVLDREYLCMYVGSTSMPTVVELNGAESIVCLFLPKKSITYVWTSKNNEYFIFQVNIFEMILVFKY